MEVERLPPGGREFVLHLVAGALVLILSMIVIALFGAIAGWTLMAMGLARKWD